MLGDDLAFQRGEGAEEQRRAVAARLPADAGEAVGARGGGASRE
jgi:hypothetical protein